MPASMIWKRIAKYRAVRSEYAGRTYDSKREARHAAELDLLVRSGELRAVIPQVSVPLPHGAARMQIDFLLILPGGGYRWQDVKGAPPTRDWILKAKIVRDAYGIEIEVIR